MSILSLIFESIECWKSSKNVFYLSVWKAIRFILILLCQTLLKSSYFHIYSEVYFYFTGQDTTSTGQKQSFLKEPIQVKGKEILPVLQVYCCLLVSFLRALQTAMFPLQRCNKLCVKCFKTSLYVSFVWYLLV